MNLRVMGYAGFAWVTPAVVPMVLTSLLTPRLEAMDIDEKGMGFHGFRRVRKTWLRSERCQKGINNFWMGHQPETMSELYSRLDLELDRR